MYVHTHVHIHTYTVSDGTAETVYVCMYVGVYVCMHACMYVRMSTMFFNGRVGNRVFLQSLHVVAGTGEAVVDEGD
jgi:hypothetical protein